MSTVDPDLRWWRRPRLLRRLAIVLWVLAFAAAAVTGWSTALVLEGAEWRRWAGAEWLVGVAAPEGVRVLAETMVVVVMWPILFAGAVDMYARGLSGRGPAWAIAHAFGAALLGLGIGGLVASVGSGADPWLPLLLALGGLLSLALLPVTRRWQRRHARLQERSRLSGAEATGTVTKIDVVTINSIDRWRLTVKFADAQGRDRWHRISVPFGAGFAPKVGDRHRIRYDPERPGRRSSIFVGPVGPRTRR